MLRRRHARRRFPTVDRAPERSEHPTSLAFAAPIRGSGGISFRRGFRRQTNMREVMIGVIRDFRFRGCAAAPRAMADLLETGT
jgi:hypothetical protein